MMLRLTVFEGTDSRKIRKSCSEHTMYSRNVGMHEALAIIFISFLTLMSTVSLYRMYIILHHILSSAGT